LGHQETIEEMRAEKASKYRELKGSRDSKEYEEWFLSYKPGDAKKPLKSSKVKMTKTIKKKKQKKLKSKKYTKKNFIFI